MLEEILNIKSGIKELRNFGIAIGIILSIIAGFLIFKEKELYLFFLYSAGFFISFGLIIPILLKPIFLIWMVIAIAIGWFMTRVILSVLFYTVITPIGIVLRVFGKDFLDLRKKKNVTSYWNQRNSNKEKNQNYEKQF